MINEEIIANAPKNWVGIKIFDGFYRWHLNDNTYSKIYDCEAFENVMQIERSRADIERIVELEAKLGKQNLGNVNG